MIKHSKTKRRRSILLRLDEPKRIKSPNEAGREARLEERQQRPKGEATIVYITLVATLLLTGCGKPVPSVAPDRPVERIISLAPNITETIYALGLGDKLVGNTPHCTYPEAARALPKIGGFGQFNYEAILLLHPDLVILHTESDAEKARLKSLGIPTLETGSYLIADILETIQRIGSACGVEAQADQLTTAIEDRISKLQSTDSIRPRVLITFGSASDGPIQAFGPACLHNELLEIAGGKNVIEGKLPFVTLSHEALLRLNPDLIIQLVPEARTPPPATHTVTSYPIYLLTNDYTCIPGPRFIQTLDDFAKIIRQND